MHALIYVIWFLKISTDCVAAYILQVRY